MHTQGTSEADMLQSYLTRYNIVPWSLMCRGRVL
jgi:hypothetical protein